MSEARDRINEVLERVAKTHYESLEAYIKAYLERTGYAIADLELCEERDHEGLKVITRYWLRPRVEPV